MRAGRLLAACLLLLRAASARAQESGPLPEGRPPEWSLAAGYGASVRLNSGRSQEHLFLFEPGVSFRLGPRLEYVVEGHFARYFTPEGTMVGLMPVGLRFFFGAGRLVPYFCLGVGFGWTGLTELPEIDRRFNFLLQGSLGVRGALAGGKAWTLEIRLSHVSNANTVQPNLGLNNIVGLAGYHF